VFEDRGARLKGIGRFQIKLAKARGSRLLAASCGDKIETLFAVGASVANGTKRTWQRRWLMSAFGGKADIVLTCWNIR
jgi:NADPH:quinone reductase-like Zn-dependent oxidoreductase